jgi:hypothetical protein
MVDVTQLLEAHRRAIDDLLEAAEAAATEGRWTEPRAQGKWSPHQVVEHVARSYEEGANVIAGRPTKLPTVPFFLRPLLRLFFRRAVKTGKFMKAKTNAGMDPARGPSAGLDSPAAARTRLDGALATFEAACRQRAASGDAVPSGAFGNVSLEDYAKFTELHTRHHTTQIPVIL